MRAFLTIGLAVTLLAGCGQEGVAPAETPLEQPAYAAPPMVTAVSRGSDGGLVIAGRAGPDERVRLIEPDGQAHGVTAQSDGRFSVPLPAVQPTDRLLNLSVQRAGQAVSSDGWLFSPAAVPERAVMLRAGGASLPVGSAPLLAIIDYDAGGGLALAGRTTPEASVTVAIDGAPRGETQADAEGRWFMTLGASVSAGSHRIAVEAGDDDQTERTVALTTGAPTGAYEVVVEADHLRVDWSLPGGGAQTTYILRE